MTYSALTTMKPVTAQDFITEIFRRQPLFTGAALCLAIMTLPTLVAMALDNRVLSGINVWVKPLKFEIALSIYLATLAWFAGWLPNNVRFALWHRIYVYLIVFSIVAEIVLISGAAAYGIRSHFNNDTAFMAGVYALMGVLAVLFTAATLVYGILIWRDDNSRLHPVFKQSVGMGLVLTFVLTLIFAGYMSSGNNHFVGGNVSDAEGFPFFGWVRDGGDLRVSHFFATHAIHILPLFGFIVSHVLPTHLGHKAITVFSIFFTVFVTYTFIEALMNKPFLSFMT